MFGTRSFFNHPFLRIAAVSLLGQGFVAQAVPPAWWGQGNPPVIESNSPSNNLGMANIGQAKWMAKSALDALRISLPTVADQVEADLVGPGKPIANWDTPTTNDEREAQHAPLLLGQLKAIAAPFYERIHSVQPTWLDAQRILNQLPETGSIYPWTLDSGDDSNRSPATIGQLKAVFSLRFETLATVIDSDADGDGLSDRWEQEHGIDSNDDGSIDPLNGANGDPDGDGVKNKDEQEAGTNPKSSEDFPVQTLRASRLCTGSGNVLPDPEISCFLISQASWGNLGTITTESFDLAKMQQALNNMPFPEAPGPDPAKFFPSNGLSSTFAYGHYRLTDDRVNASGQIAHYRVWVKAPAKPYPQEFKFIKIEESGSIGDAATYKNIGSVTLTIPANQNLSNNLDLLPNPIELASKDNQASIHLLPVEVVELSPRTKSEEGNEIVGSEKPNIGMPLTPFVEIDPALNKIAHRDIRVKIGDALKGKKVTWTLEALPGANPALIRGEWEDSPTHKDRFEASTVYEASEFQRVSQSTGETKVDTYGFTAIRLNVPPVGFNQVRIRIQIGGMSAPMDLIDMEVPAVVVIDPGHGGSESGPTLAGSSWNNAVSPSGVLEKSMTLSYGLAVRDALRDKREQDRLNLKVFMTRETDVGVSAQKRAHVARDNGADVFFVLHFNSDDDAGSASHPRTPHRSRGTLEVYRSTSNVFPQEDTELSDNLIDRIVAAIRPFDSGANHRARVLYGGDGTSGPAVSSDVYNGNTTNYHPIRTAYIEGEFIDYGANTVGRDDDLVDILLNTGPNASVVKSAISNAISNGIIDDLRVQPH